MGSNKSVRQELERRYGKKCFIERLHLRKYDKPTRFKSKKQLKRMKELTYHHIVMKKDGGKATIENGALLSAENHAWFHQQSQENQEIMNCAFQEYKKQVDECKIVFVEELEVPYKVVPMEFKPRQRKRYDRAKERVEIQKASQEYVDR